jgi:hypothetical protein
VSYSDLFHWFLKTDAGYQVAKAADIESLVDKVEALEWLDVVSYKAEGTELANTVSINPRRYSPSTTGKAETAAAGKQRALSWNSAALMNDGDCYARLRALPWSTDRRRAAESIVQKNGGDLLSDYICYIDMDELLGLDILLNGEIYHIDIDRDGEDTVYTWNGKQLDSSTAWALLNNLKNLKSSGVVSEAVEAAKRRLDLPSTGRGQVQRDDPALSGLRRCELSGRFQRRADAACGQGCGRRIVFSHEEPA